MLTDRLQQSQITYSEINAAINGMVDAMITQYRTKTLGVDGYPYATGTLMAMLTNAISQLPDADKERAMAAIHERRVASEHAHTLNQLSQTT